MSWENNTTSDDIAVAAAASIDSMDPGTIAMWIDPDSITFTDQTFCRKGANGFKFTVDYYNPSFLVGEIARATTNAEYFANTNALTTGGPQFIAMTWDLSNGNGARISLYRGTLTAAATECGYGTTTEGSGAKSDDSADAMAITNYSSTHTRNSDGHIEHYWCFGVELSLSQLVALQFGLECGLHPSCQLWFTGAIGGTPTTVPDLSGNGNAATNSGLLGGYTFALPMLWEDFGSETHPWVATTSDVTIAPANAVLTITGYAPTVTVDANIAPANATLAITGYAPTVTVDANIAPANAAIAITGYAPTVTVDANIAPATASLTVTGYAPTVTVDANIAPANATLAITGYAPSVTIGVVVAPANAALTITGYAPTVTVGVVISPANATLTITGYAPTVTVDVLITPGTASLTITGYAPVVTAAVLSVEPDHVVTFAARRRSVTFGNANQMTVTFAARRRAVTFEV